MQGTKPKPISKTSSTTYSHPKKEVTKPTLVESFKEIMYLSHYAEPTSDSIYKEYPFPTTFARRRRKRRAERRRAAGSWE